MIIFERMLTGRRLESENNLFSLQIEWSVIYDVKRSESAWPPEQQAQSAAVEVDKLHSRGSTDDRRIGYF